MRRNVIKAQIIYCGLICSMLSSCAHPPYNNFEPHHPVGRGLAVGAIVGTAVGAATTGTVAGALVGTALGGTVGAIVSTGTNPKRGLVNDLRKRDIQFVQYGDTMTLIVPVDKYFMFESPRINELQYRGLQDIIALLKLYPGSPIYVAGFSDNVGTSFHKKRISEAQAESMLTYLWANDIQAKRLKAEGYGDKNTIADNKLMHGSAMNRRIEIQWFIGSAPKCCISRSHGVMK